MRKWLLLPLAAVFVAHSGAAQLDVSVEVPRLTVAEYHRPYVAIWIENTEGHVADLAVWYDLKLRDSEGEKWLKDMRQWWRRSGRSLELPVDGLSGATRAVGEHSLSFAGDHPALAALQPGDYQLLVEAAREVGGRELVRVPFSWPINEQIKHQGTGETELGRISLTLTP
ncbi:Hypothetical protein SAMN05216198_1688 [Halopseudomonas litoralis]|uniref:DUF2271 domain-containing protein n=1 Tax=Halopseudomonas litoralis TaxID=797277 RepID=A0A1H1R9D6_9GAMM|nr:DUF2271 domain-containing protein [Halopseudomonas litoralis]SDS32126.1 Hypothetical protein SAMN05216198_1688 [Halopseudomonas litoralis]